MTDGRSAPGLKLERILALTVAFVVPRVGAVAVTLTVAELGHVLSQARTEPWTNHYTPDSDGDVSVVSNA
jgi:hypothetical protein